MTIKGMAVHVVTTTRKVGDKVYRNHLLRHSYREGGKVKTLTVANLSSLPDSVIEAIRLGLKGQPMVAAGETIEELQALPHGHVAAVVGLMRKLGMDQLFSTRTSPLRSLALALVAGRVVEPGSKLSLSRVLNPEFGICSLGPVLGVAGAKEGDLYKAMDWLLERQPKIEAALAKRHLKGGCLVLYDVSSSYFEGLTCPLARRGYSRDHRSDCLQIVYGLLCNAEGCPVAVEVFDGNTGDPKTLGAQIRKLKQRFGLDHVVLVGDRGMITSARIEKEVGPAGLDWVTALRGSSIEKLCKEQVLQPSLFDRSHLAEIQHPDFPGERLITCFNPFTQERRVKQREELLARTEEQLAKVQRGCQRKQKPLCGAGEIGITVGRALASYGMAKYFKVRIWEDGFVHSRNQALLAREAAADGIYVVRTKVSAEMLNAEQARDAYLNLAKVERAFRSLKSVDLQIRPIHHRLSDRVRAHVFLCMLAYYVEWHLRKAWEPLLFQGEPEGVSNGKRRTRRNAEENLPVGSMADLMKSLAGLTRNTVRMRGAENPFAMLSSPTPLQRRAFELLGIDPAA